MTEQTKVILSIRYVNGDRQKFEFIRPQAEQANLASRLHKFFGSDEIVLELEDRLLMIPVQNILSLEIYPKPSKLPDGAIKNARLLDS